MVLQPWTVAEFVGPKNQMNQCMRPAIKLLIKAVNAQRSLLISQKIIMSWPCHCSNGIKSLCPAEAMRKASRLPSLSWICRDFTPRCWVTLRLVGHTRVMLRCSFPPESLPVVTPSPSRWWPEFLGSWSLTLSLSTQDVSSQHLRPCVSSLRTPVISDEGPPSSRVTHLN